MQVNSVSQNASLMPKTSFGQRDLEREALENFAKADDKTLRQIAVQKASVSVNDKKHRRISNAIFYSIPVAAGLAAVVRNPAKAAAKGISKVRAKNLATFAATTLGWAGTFAIIDLMFGGARKLDKSSKKVHQFNNEHPMLSTIATIGLSIGAMLLAGKGFSKLVDKISKTPMTMSDKRMLARINRTLNDSKVINKIMEGVHKVPSAIKSFVKGVIDWSPMLLVGASIAHSFDHAKTKTAQTVSNYTQLKNMQAQAREALAAEADV